MPAVRFAELTGMTRERLRAWERRYGFPEPVRRGGGPRRYRLSDVQRVVAVRRAQEEGVPIPVAVARTHHAHEPRVGGDAFRAAVERCPAPVALLSGPVPLRLEYVNAALRRGPEPPVPGKDLVSCRPAMEGSTLVTVARDLFARDLPPAEVEHPAWSGPPNARTRSVVYRLPSQPDARPLVAVQGLQTAAEHQAMFVLAEQEQELDELRRSAERHERWLDAIAALAEELRDEPTSDVVDHALDILVRQTRAVDGALALYAGGELRVAGSRRGVLGSGRLVVAAHPELAVALRDRTGLWLGPTAEALLGIPAGLHGAGVPIAVGGEPLGLLVLVFDEMEPHDADNRRLLAAISAGMGFVLLRERLAAELAGAVSPRPPRAAGPATGG